MAKKSKVPARYDLKAADRRRNVLIQVGLTAVVILFAVGLVSYIVMNKAPSVTAGQAIRVAAPTVATAEGSTEPRVVLSLYEDFQCPHCRDFEEQFGPTIANLVSSGAVAVDYRMLAILDQVSSGYSSRSGAAAYCVADENKDAFTRFHARLFAEQPAEGAPGMENPALIEAARVAGAGGTVADCINSGKYVEMVQNLAGESGIGSTPTIQINGEPWEWVSGGTPQQLVDAIRAVAPDLPGLDQAIAPVPDPAS
ncbi:MAG: DsbA family protein [Mycobacterium sp.]